MTGAILGDIVGSIYEFDNIKTKEFELFDKDCFFTDDSVMTIAVAKALLDFEDVTEENVEDFKENLIKVMHEIGREYPDCGYGGHFYMWIMGSHTKPYNSYGNGSAMRVSPVGWYAKSLEQAELIASNRRGYPQSSRGYKGSSGNRRGSVPCSHRCHYGANQGIYRKVLCGRFHP